MVLLKFASYIVSNHQQLVLSCLESSCSSADVGSHVWVLPRRKAALLPADTGWAGLCPEEMAECEPSAVQKTPLSWWRTPWRPASLRRAGQGPVWTLKTAGHASQWREWWEARRIFSVVLVGLLVDVNIAVKTKFYLTGSPLGNL